jgi:hypothetical protein
VSGGKVYQVHTPDLETVVAQTDNDGGLGIGTTSIPHGGIGAAKLAIEGANASTAGPHVQFTTASDDHPLLQVYNWSHDNIALIFDAYYDGGFKSSDAGSNFYIRKNDDHLRFAYSSGNAQGGAVTWTNALIINSSGKVGIGTDDVPHSSVGAAKLAIEGANASTAGPHVQFTTASDNHPLLQVYNWSHDNIALIFDAYYDGGFKSSDSGSNFYIRKNDDHLRFAYASGTAQGASVSWTNALIINSSGKVGIGTDDVPHSSVGWAKFAIEGVNNASTGPHVQFTTASDNHPLMQILPLRHDDVALNFDCYYDGTWRSGDAGSNFQIYKTGDALRIRYGAGVPQGLGITWNDGFILDSNGAIGIGQGTSFGQLISIDQSSTTSGWGVIHMRQRDVDQEFLSFQGTAAASDLTRSIVDEGDQSTTTRAGFVKIRIVDDGNQVTDADYYMAFYTLA